MRSVVSEAWVAGALPGYRLPCALSHSHRGRFRRVNANGIQVAGVYAGSSRFNTLRKTCLHGSVKT